jgi:hypothetical protein
VFFIQGRESVDCLLRTSLFSFQPGLPLLKIGRQQLLDMGGEIADAGPALFHKIGIQVQINRPFGR